MSTLKSRLFESLQQVRRSMAANGAYDSTERPVSGDPMDAGRRAAKFSEILI